MDYSRIPPATLETLQNWAKHGLEPGSFVMAVLENNLIEAVSRGDRFNLMALLEICAYVYNEMPVDSYGSPSIVREWRDLKRMEAK